jgi:WD40-like Beta Propeller Repeat
VAVVRRPAPDLADHSLFDLAMEGRHSDVRAAMGRRRGRGSNACCRDLRCASTFPATSRFAAALGDTTFAIPTTPTATAATTTRRNTARYVWPVLLAASLVLAWLGWNRPAPTAAVERVNLALPEGHQLKIWGGRSKPFDISPDGRRLVYENQVGGTPQLFVRDMDSFESRALDGTTGAHQQFFSRDGKWIARAPLLVQDLRAPWRTAT